eukprot:361976-Chlamydomonas_euryale.AAC.2
MRRRRANARCAARCGAGQHKCECEHSAAVAGVGLKYEQIADQGRFGVGEMESTAPMDVHTGGEPLSQPPLLPTLLSPTSSWLTVPTPPFSPHCYRQRPPGFLSQPPPSPHTAIANVLLASCPNPAFSPHCSQLGPVMLPPEREKALMRSVARAPTIVYFSVAASFQHYAGGIYAVAPRGLDGEGDGGGGSDGGDADASSSGSGDSSGEGGGGSGGGGDCGTVTNHAMLVVGYNASAQQPYWIVRNSWGSSWGEGGYARIAMTGNGKGPCGMYQVCLLYLFGEKIGAVVVGGGGGGGGGDGWWWCCCCCARGV